MMIALSPVVFIAAIFGLGVMLILALFISPVLVVFAVRRMWSDALLRQSLAKQGRLLPLSELAPRLDHGEGTLLEETAPKGAFRIWWTSDELAPLEPNIAVHERFVQLFDGIDEGGFNKLCLESYIGKARGKASLTTILPHHARTGKLARRFPNAKRVMVVRLDHA
jgi:hypothetical protein